MEELQENVEKYKGIESTLQNTLVMAQLAADDIKKAAQKEADKILLDAQGDARQTARALDQDIILKKKTLEDLEKQLDVYRAKMESLLISQLELLKESNKD
jgi:cell division initiation protein